MKCERSEDLPCWNAAIDLAVRVYALTRDRFFAQSGDLRDQLRRAALSVSNNIGEGFERGSTAELLSFLYIARGSAGEVRSMLHFVERALAAGLTPPAPAARKSGSVPPPADGTYLPPAQARSPSKTPEAGAGSGDSGFEISNLKSRISDLMGLAESCSRQLRAWADSLQNSDIKGQRHLDARACAAYEQQKSAAAFQQRLAQSLHEARPDSFPPPEQDAGGW